MSTATALEVTTVDGDVVFSGAFQQNGRYRFESHDGSLLLVLPENTSATFQVRRYDGPRTLDSTIPLKPSGEPTGPPRDLHGRQRLGAGRNRVVRRRREDPQAGRSQERELKTLIRRS